MESKSYIDHGRYLKGQKKKIKEEGAEEGWGGEKKNCLPGKPMKLLNAP